MNKTVEEFVELVSEKSPLQKNYLEKWNITEKEMEDLEDVIKFLMDDMGYSIGYIADSYIFINSMVMEETYYFVQNGKYRYSTFDEADKAVYDNPEYMSRYMCGLTISDYIWSNHIEMIRFYDEILSKHIGLGGYIGEHDDVKRNYLEVGPGYGQFLIRSIKSGLFDECTACDVSETSANTCMRYMKYCGMDNRCTILHKNFFDFSVGSKFDFIVMGEVLEHVENPLEMLKQIYKLLEGGGMTYITTVINAPTLDHIYLFDTIESVLDMAKEAGFKIIEYRCATAGNIKLEKAIKKKMAISIGMLMAKGEIEYEYRQNGEKKQFD